MHVNLDLKMAVFSKISRQSLINSKFYLLLPSHFRFQSIRTLILQPGSDSVKVHRHSDTDSGIIEINMDRPEAKNALGKEMLRGLLNSFEDISRDSAANVLMICSSVSRVFCAGADLKERKAMNVSEVRAAVNSLRSTFSFLEALQIPTIAVIEGAALGGGLEMAMACDLRICGEDAKLALPETGLAVIPGAGGTQRLPRLVGKSIAKELIFTGRKISARDALSIGLINYCVPAGQAYSKALDVARDINQKEGRDMNVSEVRAVANSLRSTFSFLEALQIPTIAVIEGTAFGGGREMALSCDIGIRGEDAKLALPETGLAIILAAGGTQRLPRLVGKSNAKELIFSGRKISARDALSIGLINYCVPAGEA